MLKRSRFGLFSGVHPIADGAAMHEDDGMMAIFSGRCRRQSVKILCRNGLEDFFKTESGHMMTFIHDHHAVIFDKRLDVAAAIQGLHDGDVHNAGEIAFTRANKADDALRFFASTLFF